MAAAYAFREFQVNQQRTLNRAVETYQAYLAALQASQPLKGGMHWKKIKGREYLYKYRDRYGHGHSLGPRSPHTEPLWAEFGRQRWEVAALLGARRQQLAEAARFCRAALIHRVPEPVVRILRRLAPGDLAPLMVIDTHALHAFEFAAGVFIDASPDSPLWSGAAQGLTLAATAVMPPEEFLALLRRADRSYKILPVNGGAALPSRSGQSGAPPRSYKILPGDGGVALPSRGGQSGDLPRSYEILPGDGGPALPPHGRQFGDPPLSYKTLPGDGLTAVNQQGFRVRLLPPPTAHSGYRTVVKDAPGVTVPAESGDLAALMAAPKFSQVVIGRRGEPVTMTVPDPRALALHKLWLSQQEDREPFKQTRDRCQAAALAELILRYLPHYHFFSAELQRFPPEVTRLAENLVEGYEVAADLEADS